MQQITSPIQILKPENFDFNGTKGEFFPHYSHSFNEESLQTVRMFESKVSLELKES